MKYLLASLLLLFAISAHATSTTWDPGNVSTHVTLSGGNLVATRTTGNASNYSMAFSTTSKSSGKQYFEITVTHPSDADTGWGFGLINAGMALDGSGGDFYVGAQSAGGTGSNSIGVLENDAATSYYQKNHGALTQNPGWQQVNNPPTGDVIGLAVDIPNNLVWVQDCTLGGGWNVGTTGTQNPSTGQGGVSSSSVTNAAVFIGVSLYYTSSAVASATLNTGGSAFTCTQPTGFTAWDPPAAATGVTRTMMGVGQ
jgi:hypothetical protein